MSKEELIKLIEAMTIEEVNSISITYFTEKDNSRYDYKERQLKTISFGSDINRKLENITREMEDMYERIQRNNYMTLEAMVNEKLSRSDSKC